jgi:hypothetical protein
MDAALSRSSQTDSARQVAPASASGPIRSVEFASVYDAGVLLVHASERQWAKLCFEYSPQQRPTLVTVVTRGTSDDCNSYEAAPGQPGPWQTADITWLPPTAQNLATLTVPIPAGYRQVPLAQAVPPDLRPIPVGTKP